MSVSDTRCFHFEFCYPPLKSWRFYCGRIVALKRKICLKNCSVGLSHSGKPISQRVCKIGELLLRASVMDQILHFLLVLRLRSLHMNRNKICRWSFHHHIEMSFFLFENAGFSWQACHQAWAGHDLCREGDGWVIYQNCITALQL